MPDRVDDDDLDALAAAAEADRADTDAHHWANDLPEAPPLDPEHTTAVFVPKKTTD